MKQPARFAPVAALLAAAAGCAAAHPAVTVAPNPAGNPAPPLPGYHLAWREEFDGMALDMSRWTAYEGPRRDATNARDAVSVADGALTITTYTEDDEHRSGFLDTAGKEQWTFGWFEARVRFASSPGEWGAGTGSDATAIFAKKILLLKSYKSRRSAIEKRAGLARVKLARVKLARNFFQEN